MNNFQKYLFFDTETTGIPNDYKAPCTNTDNWPRLIQLGWLLTDAEGVESAENIVYEDAVLFYNPAKSRFDENDYLATIPYGEKGLSREFLAYFATFLRDTAELALDDLIDFLADEEAESFEIVWNQEVFEEGKVGLEESTFYPYPRY